MEISKQADLGDEVEEAMDILDNIDFATVRELLTSAAGKLP